MWKSLIYFPKDFNFHRVSNSYYSIDHVVMNFAQYVQFFAS